jgi:hypothetical protein
MTQRREPDREAGEPMEERLRESPALHRSLEIFVGRGDDADVDLSAPASSERTDLPGLQDPEEHLLDLSGRGADLVEEQSSAVRLRCVK